jgi:hypothetical protein
LRDPIHRVEAISSTFEQQPNPRASAVETMLNHINIPKSIPEVKKLPEIRQNFIPDNAVEQ